MDLENFDVEGSIFVREWEVGVRISRDNNHTNYLVGDLPNGVVVENTVTDRHTPFTKLWLEISLVSFIAGYLRSLKPFTDTITLGDIRVAVEKFIRERLPGLE